MPNATATPSSQPQPVNGAYGILVDTASSSTQYTVALIGTDGKVAATANASAPPIASCGNAAAAPAPLPVSASNSRVYFMDATGAVRYLGPDGATGQGTAIPASTSSRRAMFAVSPDDQRIAVVVADYTATGASTRLYVEDMHTAANHVDIFSETGAYTLWPIGWHGTNNLVVAKVVSCTQGGGPFCCGPLELHVVDPATGTRRFTLGSPACVIAGPPSPAGVACESTNGFTNLDELNWTGGVYRPVSIPGPEPALTPPDPSYPALVSNGGTLWEATNWPMEACAWIDDNHILAGGDAHNQPRVGTTNGSMIPVQAQGTCGGRIPGGL